MHRKQVVFMSRTIKILISNWPWTQKIQPAVKGRKGSCFWLFSLRSRVGHTLRPIFMLWLVKIWQVSSCEKCMQNLLETCLLIAEADRVLCHLVMPLTVFFHWMYKMKCSCYQDSFVIHGWFVCWVFGNKCTACGKSDFG